MDPFMIKEKTDPWFDSTEDYSFADLDVYSADPCDPFYRFFFLQVQGWHGQVGWVKGGPPELTPRNKGVRPV